MTKPDCYEYFKGSKAEVLQKCLEAFWEMRVEDCSSVKDHLEWLLAIAYEAGRDSKGGDG